MIFKDHSVPELRANNSDIFASSRSGLGPRPSCDTAEELEPACLGCGVPEREPALLRVLLWGPGGVDAGRVDICNGGSGFPFACGRTSSRFIGIPRVIRCCRRMRERVQLGAFTTGGD